MESLIEFIVFILTMFLLIVLSSRQAKAAAERRSEHPEEAEDEDRALKDFLRSMNLEVIDEEPPPTPKPERMVKKPKPAPRLEEVEQPIIEAIELSDDIVMGEIGSSSEQMEQARGYSAARLLRPASIKQAVVVREILGPPKALQ